MGKLDKFMRPEKPLRHCGYCGGMTPHCRTVTDEGVTAWVCDNCGYTTAPKPPRREGLTTRTGRYSPEQVEIL